MRLLEFEECEVSGNLVAEGDYTKYVLWEQGSKYWFLSLCKSDKANMNVITFTFNSMEEAVDKANKMEEKESPR